MKEACGRDNATFEDLVSIKCIVESKLMKAFMNSDMIFFNNYRKHAQFLGTLMF